MRIYVYGFKNYVVHVDTSKLKFMFIHVPIITSKTNQATFEVSNDIKVYAVFEHCWRQKTANICLISVIAISVSLKPISKSKNFAV